MHHSLAETVCLGHVIVASELEDGEPVEDPDPPALAKPPDTPLDGHRGAEDEDMLDIDEMVESKSRLYFYKERNKL